MDHIIEHTFRIIILEAQGHAKRKQSWYKAVCDNCDAASPTYSKRDNARSFMVRLARRNFSPTTTEEIRCDNLLKYLS